MKTLFLDLQNGIAGDMLVAALLDLFEDPQAVLKELQSLGLPVSLELIPSEKCGLVGKRFIVRVQNMEEGEGGIPQKSHSHKHEDKPGTSKHTTHNKDVDTINREDSIHGAQEKEGDGFELFAEGGKRIANFVTGLVNELVKGFSVEPPAEITDDNVVQPAQGESAHTAEDTAAGKQDLPEGYDLQGMYEAFHDVHEPLTFERDKADTAVETEIILKASREMVNQLKKVFYGLEDIVHVEEKEGQDTLEKPENSDKPMDFELLIRGGKELADRVAKLGKKALEKWDRLPEEGDALLESLAKEAEAQDGGPGNKQGCPAHAQEHCHAHSHEYMQEHPHRHNHPHCHVQEECHSHGHPHHHEHPHKHGDEHRHPHDHEHMEHHSHSHHSLAHIMEIIDGLAIKESVKQRAVAVYERIAEAESKVHGVPVPMIHFHEVGDLDAVADIVSACYLLDKLEVDQVLASPINTGSGSVHCAHGILPVPAPATLLLLEGLPIYSARAQSELCTPTGAALAGEFVNKFGEMPQLVPKKVGYGMGKKDFPFANCLRAILAEAVLPPVFEEVELVCNLDDMSPEALAFACEVLFEKGALDVWTSAIYMKKGRLGTALHVLCKEADKPGMIAAILQHTSSIGIREYSIQRHKMERNCYESEAYGQIVHYKVSKGYGQEKRKYEYEDLARIAKLQGLGIEEVRKHLEYLESVSAWV